MLLVVTNCRCLFVPWCHFGSRHGLGALAQGVESALWLYFWYDRLHGSPCLVSLFCFLRGVGFSRGQAFGLGRFSGVCCSRVGAVFGFLPNCAVLGVSLSLSLSATPFCAALSHTHVSRRLATSQRLLLLHAALWLQRFGLSVACAFALGPSWSLPSGFATACSLCAAQGISPLVGNLA